MKKIPFLLTLGLIIGLFFTTTQAFASPALTGGNPHKTPGPPSTPTGKPGNSGMHGKPENYRGTIAAVDPGSLTLTLIDGSSVIIGLNSDTKIKVPKSHGSTAANLQVGMNAMIQAKRDQSKALIARFVMVIPGKPARRHYVGWVTAYSAGASITIQAHDGNSYTFTLTSDTKILPSERAGELAIGSLVTIIAPRDPAALGSTAQGIVVHPAGSGAGSQPAASPTP